MATVDCDNPVMVERIGETVYLTIHHTCNDGCSTDTYILHWQHAAQLGAALFHTSQGGDLLDTLLQDEDR